MDQDLVKSMFLRARDQYEGAMRWALIFIIVCLLFQLVNFSQFVRLNQQLLNVEAEIERLSTLEPEIASIAAELQRIEKDTIEGLESHLDQALQGLISDFDDLDATLAQMLTPVTEGFTSGGADALLDRDLFQDSPIQAAPSEPMQVRREFIFDEDVRQKIVNARDIDELRIVILPVIEQQILQPRFDELNQYWKEDALPKLIQESNSILLQLDEYAALYPEGEELWNQARENIQLTIEVANSMQFQPATNNPEWWASVAGKQAVLTDISEAATEQFVSVSGSQQITDLHDQISAVYSNQEELKNNLQQEKVSLEEDFKEQQTKLASLGKAFEIISLDLAFVVSMFPLLLGVVLGGITIWSAYRLRELAWAVKLMVERTDDLSLQDWFYARTWFHFPTAQKSSEKRSESLNWRGNWPWILGSIVRPLIYIIWISIASWQLIVWGAYDPRRTILIALEGFLAVGVGEVYRWLVSRDIGSGNQKVLEETQL